MDPQKKQIKYQPTGMWGDHLTGRPTQPSPFASTNVKSCLHFLSGGFMAAGLWLVKNNYIP